MKIIYPQYYKAFRCIASACPDSCCHEWEVDVDPETAAFYRSLPGELGNRLRQVLRDTEDGICMTIENDRCPMWRQDGLCRIQAELGHDALCETCRNFPRLRHDYGSFVELGLELSCPEAARLILGSEGGFLVSAQPGGEEPEYDPGDMELLRGSRKIALEFLQTQENVPQALGAILLYAHDVQAALDGLGDIGTPEECLAELGQFTGGDLQAVFEFFRGLEILTEDWRQRLAQKPGKIRWNDTLRNLFRYMLERYWLQAISDLDLVCRVKLGIAACLLVGSMGGDLVETAQLFSKEIENDPDNVEAILEGAYTSPALTDANLLGLLH